MDCSYEKQDKCKILAGLRKQLAAKDVVTAGLRAAYEYAIDTLESDCNPKTTKLDAYYYSAIDQLTKALADTPAVTPWLVFDIKNEDTWPPNKPTRTHSDWHVIWYEDKWHRAMFEPRYQVWFIPGLARPHGRYVTRWMPIPKPPDTVTTKENS